MYLSIIVGVGNQTTNRLISWAGIVFGQRSRCASRAGCRSLADPPRHRGDHALRAFEYFDRSLDSQGRRDPRAGGAFPAEVRCCASWDRPTATSASSRTPTASTSTGRSATTSRSGTGRTSARGGAGAPRGPGGARGDAQALPRLGGRPLAQRAGHRSQCARILVAADRSPVARINGSRSNERLFHPVRMCSSRRMPMPVPTCWATSRTCRRPFMASSTWWAADFHDPWADLDRDDALRGQRRVDGARLFRDALQLGE